MFVSGNKNKFMHLKGGDRLKSFQIHRGLVVPVDRANIDTDVLIPKQFLKRIERSGFGQFLMYDWRYNKDGALRSDFTLNQERYQGASVLLARENFGSGSSRENAVWALQDFGFRVIIAPSFADIFRNNSSKNGLLLIDLPTDKMDELFKRVQVIEGYQLTIDLFNQLITDGYGLNIQFPFDEKLKEKFVKGLDDIAYTMMYEQKIERFEKNRPGFMNPST